MSNIDKKLLVYAEQLFPGRAWSGVIKRDYRLRLIDEEGNANVSALFFNADERSERYNMPDTLKAQHTAYLSKGKVCFSDMGRILFSITDENSGWHDTFCGVSDAKMVAKQYGSGTYQDLRNDFYRNGYDLFLIELAKWNLSKKDLVANINFFSKVVTDEDGNLSFVTNHSSAGDYVDLRAELNSLVVLNTCPHPLNPAKEYSAKPVTIQIWQNDTTADDSLQNSKPEIDRGYANTKNWFCQH